MGALGFSKTGLPKDITLSAFVSVNNSTRDAGAVLIALDHTIDLVLSSFFKKWLISRWDIGELEFTQSQTQVLFS